MRFDGFDWDRGNIAKCQKHGVSLAEIEELFLSGPTLDPDPFHSREEVRIRAIGPVASGRWIFLAFTFREREGFRLIRPISARYMHRKEFVFYEKTVFRT